MLNKEDRDKVYVFSSYFYGRLTQVSDKHAPYEKDKSLTEAQRQYKRVERWTKNVDLFEKDMVIFPIFSSVLGGYLMSPGLMAMTRSQWASSQIGKITMSYNKILRS